MHYHTFFSELLSWPDGIIVGNLIASVVWSSLFEWRLHIHHKKTDKAVSDRLDAQDVKLDEHHEDMKRHIDKRTNVETGL